MDAGAIMQDDTSIENLRAMTETAREFGVYAAGTYRPAGRHAAVRFARLGRRPQRLTGMARPAPAARRGRASVSRGKSASRICPTITGSPELIRKIWEDMDAFGNMYIWQLLLSF